MAEAPPVVLVGAAVPAEPLLLEPPVVVLLAAGVKGAVMPNPGSCELGTVAAKAAKVLSPVVGGLIAPYMPE